MNIVKLSVIALAISGLTACNDDAENDITHQIELAVGHSECRFGGVQIDSGVDDNDSDTLETDEIDKTAYVCNMSLTSLSRNQIINTQNPWYSAAEKHVQTNNNTTDDIVVAGRGRGKNVILFVGDGMSVSTVTASRIFEGQGVGMMGEENSLSFENMPFSGFVKTYNVDAQTPDSAGTMTAMITGVKTDAGVLGIDASVERADCTTGNALLTALELAEIGGKSTGIVSTARVTHATPAATYAKSADRDWEDISDMESSNQEDIDAGCKDIADQLINFEANLEAQFEGLDVDGIEVVFGGGRRHFLPRDPAFNSPDAVSAIEGDRTDGRNLIAKWMATYPQGVYVMDQNGFDAIDPDVHGQVFGLFNESHMQYESDRQNDIAGEPSLTQMTEKAIDILDNNEQGFFLMVESGRIDHAHHAGNAFNAVNDTVELAQAVQIAMDKTDPQETLIIVTADHGHVFTIGGYPKRGNPILGKVVAVGQVAPALASDNLPYTTLTYNNGLGFRDFGTQTDADTVYDTPAVTGRVDLSNVNVQSAGFHQETLVPLSSETHAGVDVAMFARGPGAHLVSGTHEQSMIFHIMDYSVDLVKHADDAVAR